MPLYEYRCPACRHAWDALQDRWDSPAPVCPACGKSQAQRQFSTFAVVAPGAATEGTPNGACGTGSCACRRDQS